MIGVLVLFSILVLGILGLAAGLQSLGVLPRRDAVPDSAARPGDVQRIEDALSALGSRLDRLEDQQRFLERLLENRPPTQLPPGEGAGSTQAEDPGGGDSILFDVKREID